MSIKSRIAFRNVSSAQPWLLRGAALAACAGFLLTSLAPSNVEGCGWSGFDRSVRFSSSSENKDRLPPLPRLRSTREETDVEPFWESAYASECCGGGGDEEYDRYYQTLELVPEAIELIRKGDLSEARRRIQRFLDVSAVYVREGTDEDHRCDPLREYRNESLDLIDVLRERDRGVSTAAIQAYTEVRTGVFGSSRKSDKWVELARLAARESRIADNLAYINAAYLYKRGRYSEAGEGFETLLAKWPKSEKRPAALLMSGVSKLRYAQEYSSDKTDETRIRELEVAERRLNSLLSTDANGPYAKDARGWLAHLALARDDHPTALVAYYGMLADASDLSVQRVGVRSLNLVRDGVSEPDMLEVERRLEANPEVALVYAYYEIYNEESLLDIEAPWTASGLSGGQQEQFERVVAFASRMADRFPKGAVGAGFATRVAGACVELNRFDDAVKFANRALTAGPTAREAADALLLLATAEHGAQRFDRARAAGERLLALSPDRRTAETARRRLAMICEDAGDLAGALDQYRALEYEADAAYLIDVLMTPSELEAYLSSRPVDKDIDWLRYALAVRLLREGSYGRAHAELKNVRTGRSEFDGWSQQYETQFVERGSSAPSGKKFAGLDPQFRRPRAEWVAADMQTAKDLLALQAEAQRVSTAEFAAEAQYKFAAFLFDRESLLFYNPSLWWGSRAGLMNDLAYAAELRLPGEAERVWIHNNEHDALAQSVNAFLDVVEKYPETSAARDALYSAAVAHERLAAFNGYWGEQYSNGRHAGRRMVTYDDVRRAYPSYQLPKGTFGWEAYTRTVNGGPAWDAPPPKPKPVPLWRHYNKRVPEVIAEIAGPPVEAVWSWVCGVTTWTIAIVKRAAVLGLQAILIATILVAWIAAVRSSLRLALETAKGHVRSRALLPASLAYRPRDHAWMEWASQRVKALRTRLNDTGLSIVQTKAPERELCDEPRLDDRLVVFIERARVFLGTTPEGLALHLVVVTHLPILLLVAMMM